MRFIENGPDIPERLLQAHEDGRVVFFCGAGISYPAGLPGFSDLVDKLYQVFSVRPNPVQQTAIDAKQFDMAIGLLEEYMVDGRTKVRHELAKILTPKRSELCKNNAEATATHKALLTLAKNRDDKPSTRLVTTNFDRLFEEVKKKQSLLCDVFKAPLLPVHKTKWDGVVYLHGLLPKKPTQEDLNQLVISSGDFGRAYLIEGWATRFVRNVFRHFTVCFVGYSINDPVLRYMVDAFATERSLGESIPEMFAFGDYNQNKEKSANEWKAKRVTPILYSANEGDHKFLHKTLHEWASIYQKGVYGKEEIIEKYAKLFPRECTDENDFIGRVRWALSDPSGLPAKRFAELDPVPPLDWLEPLSAECYRHADLERFGITPQATVGKNLTCSLMRRPSPYSLAPWMTIVDNGDHDPRWDKVMCHLAHWLSRHLNDPRLLIWLIKRGYRLHKQLIWRIERRLEELHGLEQSNDTSKLEHIKEHAPNAIPHPVMRRLWRLLLNGQVKFPFPVQQFSCWLTQFESDGLTVSVRLALREALKPFVVLNEPVEPATPDILQGGKDSPIRMNQLVEGEIWIASDEIYSCLNDLSDNLKQKWEVALPKLLDDFNILLRDILDLMCELEFADSKSDFSYLYQPSISDHPQNPGSSDWTALIQLARDAWLATSRQSRERARRIAEEWAHGPYPVFRRLALFAAAQQQEQHRIIPPRQALDWLLMDERCCLWSVDTTRETMRLLVSLASQLDAEMVAELEHSILAGPPRKLYRDDIDSGEWNDIQDRSIWLRLAKLAQAGATLSEKGRSQLDSLASQHSFELAEDESDEFPFWMGIGLHVDRDLQASAPIPRSRRGILDYMRRYPELDDTQSKDWHKLCQERFEVTAYALCEHARNNNWPRRYWEDALHAWRQEHLCIWAWRYMVPVIVKAPDDWVTALSWPLSRWLWDVAKTFEDHEDHFLTLCQRIVQLDFKDDSNTKDLVYWANNRPVGHVTHALLNWWQRQKPSDGQGLPESINLLLRKICDPKIVKSRHGRVVLATHVFLLFRSDQSWTKHYLLPLFDWNFSEIEAQAVWQGFLWSPRMCRPLLKELKPFLLDTVSRYPKLEQENGRKLARFLTFAALDPGDIFTRKERIAIIRQLPDDGLRESTHALLQALDGAGDQREIYWKNRISPFWKEIWPPFKSRALTAYSENLAHLCIAAGDEFPDALKTIGSWLGPLRHPWGVIGRLCRSGLYARFQEDTLKLLSIILNDQSSRPPRELRRRLTDIIENLPDLKKDQRFKRMDAIARKFDI